MAVSSTVTEAKKWIDNLSMPDGLHGSWRLLVLETTNRVLPDGTVKETPVKIRRFAQGCPWALLPEAMKYLCESAPYSGIIYNGLELDGVFRPTRTRWVRDDQSTVDKNRADNTYTLVQDLIDSSVADPHTVESGLSCSDEVITSWNWDAASIESVPDDPRQGVSYSLQSVSRNEDGTFNYALVKRTAFTQHSGPVQSECDEFTSTVVEMWDNVYGTPPNFTDHLGNAIGLPSICDHDKGVTYQVSVQENPDCTFKLSVVKKTAKGVTSEVSSQKTIFEYDSSGVSRADSSPVGEAPAASGGVIVTRKSELRPDGKYDNTEQIKTEKEVLSSSKTVTVTRRGRRVTVVNSNQAEPASTADLGIGMEVRVEKTPGGLYNNTESVWDKTAPLKVGERCAVDLMKHSDERMMAGAEMPPEGSHVSGGGVGGHVVSRHTVVGDEGEVTQTIVDEQEKEVLSQKESWRVGLTGIVHTITDLQTGSPASAPSFSKENVGTVVENEKTPGGLVTVTRSSLIRSSSKVSSGDGCERTVFEHSDTSSVNDPSGSFGGHAKKAGGGHYYEIVSRMNDDGSSTVTSKDTYEEPVASAVVAVTKSLHGVRVKTTHRNQVAPASTSGLKVGESVTNEVTKGGRYDQTIETFSAEDVGGIGSECRQHSLQHDHSTMSNQSSKPAEEVSAAVGTVRERVIRRTEYGTWDVTDTTKTAKNLDATVNTGTVLKSSVKVVKRNAASISVSPGAANVETSATSTPNEFGRYDATIETVTYKPADATIHGGADKASAHVKTYKNSLSADAGDTPSVNKDVDVHLSINDHGSYDKTVRVTDYKPREGSSAGKGAFKAKVSVTTKNNDTSPSITDTPSVNKDVDVSISQNEHGSYDKSIRITEYLERTASLQGKGADKARVTVTTYANSTSQSISDSPAVNKDVDVSISQNEHGSYDKSVRVTDYKERLGQYSGKGADKATVSASVYVNSLTASVTESPSVNKDVDVSITQNEHGSYDKTIRVVNYKTRTGEAKGVGAVNALVDVSTVNNDPTQSVSGSPSVNKEVDVSISQNEHGSYDKTIRITTYKKAGAPVTASNPLYDELQEVYTNDEVVPTGVAAVGSTVSVSCSPNAHGSYHTSKVTRTAKAKSSSVITWNDTFYHHRRKVYRNFTAPEPPPSDGADKLDGEEASCSFQINEFGLYDGSWEIKTARLGNSFLINTSGTETYVTDTCTVPNDDGKYWAVHTETEMQVRYIATRNPQQIYAALTGGYVYNGHSSKIIGSLGNGVVLLAVYKKPGKYKVAHEQRQY